ncbi:MAG TPA: isocitrate lyase/phosphoenolpyruvate mutase family protein [Candidatus Acidoferrum sp.]|nr:isocitrate lyase/phosphoenolpyruvate mutase family protein [Candidatus Acidoferrum sp.]
MINEQRAKGERFRRLHTDSGTFLAPNAWNAGSARMLEAAGFPALSATSGGIALSLGVPDYEGRLGREEMMRRIEGIARAVDLPVSADLEGGYGVKPEGVAETIRQAVQAGVVGGNIDDYTGRAQAPLYDMELAADRIRAAREAADKTGIAFTLAARTDAYVAGRADPLREAVRRAYRYRQAGADCIFVPGVVDHAEIVSLVREIDAPLNIVVGFAGQPMTVQQLAILGVKRISIGGSLARATFALIRHAADEMITKGTFSFAEHQLSDAELSSFFGSWTEKVA